MNSMKFGRFWENFIIEKSEVIFKQYSSLLRTQQAVQFFAKFYPQNI